MFKSLSKLLTKVVYAPIIIAQGRYVKKVTPKLPEAAGERSGITGEGQKIRLLIVGDSAAAGVGVDNQSQALTGNLVSALSDCYQVDWLLLAKSGHTTLDSLKMLSAQPQQTFDIIVTSLGVNDVTGTLPASAWIIQQQDLIARLREQFNSQQILITQVPPMGQFPALPQPLRRYLGARASQFNRKLTTLIDSQVDCQLIDINAELNPEDMAEDGFHPGPVIYQHWAELVAEKIKSQHSYK
ncbi:SGNH/GDSL hydrolase family protein [Moritella sp. Urea-trap-13]|uniref:SGNH/GDSL hydrolase family protein n=1 Tax=Moritella sp. Urea-trap-13 TaxID=2058327 RepID=UPI000C33E8A9|nr:SGNH/GDSL hydrolase family protein [Moritella sp. Urea-trap-13]PKH06839.1 lipase [Moritella sp. Urea-trap-13]